MINKMNIRSIFTDIDKIYSRVTIQNKGYQNRMRGDRNGHAYTYVELGPEGSVGNMRKCRWEEEKKRETAKREVERERKRERKAYRRTVPKGWRR